MRTPTPRLTRTMTETKKTILCATILKAYRSENEINSDYEHLGKIIVADMEDAFFNKDI